MSNEIVSNPDNVVKHFNIEKEKNRLLKLENSKLKRDLKKANELIVKMNGFTMRYIHDGEMR